MKQVNVNALGAIVDGGTVLQLSTPIKQGDDLVTELHLKPVTFAVIRKFGMFARGEMDIGDIDFDLVGKYIEYLATIPPSMVNQLAFDDVLKCVEHISTFFRSDRDKE